MCSNRFRLIAFIGFVLAMGLAPQALSDEPGHARTDRWLYTTWLDSDLTFVQEEIVEATIFDALGAEWYRQAYRSFYPSTQSLEVAEAWVLQPDGSRLTIGPNAIFTRSGEQDQDAPGFSGQQVKTIVFPNLRSGSKTHVKWRRRQLEPSFLGYNAFLFPDAAFDGELRHDILLPADLKLVWGARGDVAVTDTVSDGLRHISARIGPGQAIFNQERYSVDAADYQPLFMATTLRDLADYGARLFEQAKDRDEPTPEIRKLAAEIVGARTGLAAARAIHDWIIGHIGYVAVWLDPNDGYVPHRADEVLRNGYGDCKDHVVLMQALLRAIGIPSEAAIVNWGRTFEPWPLAVPQQFNHVLLHLPDYGVYDNPTDHFSSFGALDDRLFGKTVVLVTESGGSDILPEARPEDFCYRRQSLFSVDALGTISASAKISLSPSLAIYGRRTLAKDEAASLVTDSLAKTLEGGTGNLDPGRSQLVTTDFAVRANWQSPYAVAMDDERVFMPIPTGFDLYTIGELRDYLAASGRRRSPLFFGASDYEWDSEIRLPPGYGIERLPKDVEIDNEAGRYRATYRRTGIGFAVSRHLVLRRSIYPPALYPDFAAVILKALADSRAFVVLASAQRSPLGSDPSQASSP